MATSTQLVAEIGSAPGSYVRRNLAGVLAVFLGIASLTLAILPERVIDRPRHTLGQELRNFVTSLVGTGELPVDVVEYQQALERYRTAAIVTALLGLALLVAARVRREDKPLLWAGAGVVALAMFWEWIVVGIVVAIVVLILAGSSP